MSFEKVKIVRIEQTPPNKQTGEIHHFLIAEISKEHTIYMSDTALKNKKLFESLVGRECLLPLNEGTRNGKVNFSFEGDCNPIPLQAPIASPEENQLEKSEADLKTVENKKPLFSGSRG